MAGYRAPLMLLVWRREGEGKPAVIIIKKKEITDIVLNEGLICYSINGCFLTEWIEM